MCAKLNNYAIIEYHIISPATGNTTTISANTASTITYATTSDFTIDSNICIVTIFYTDILFNNDNIY